NQSASQIDNIWISAKVINEFTKSKLWEADGITNSDYIILKTNEKIVEEWKIEEIMNVQELNKAWHVWNSIIKQAAKKHIKEARICSKEYYAFTMKATTLYNALKKVNELEYVKRETEYKILIVSAMSWHTENKTKLEQQIDELRKALHKAREVENQKEKRE
ncbi:27000_t:CDS:2, partial [Gigaspora margarita]